MPTWRANTGRSTRPKRNQTTRNAESEPALTLLLVGESKADTDYMGFYQLLTDKDDQPVYHNSRPVYIHYSRKPTLYIYYWEKTGKWLVGENIKQGDKYFLRVRDSSVLPEDITATWKNKNKERRQLHLERARAQQPTPGMDTYIRNSGKDSGIDSGASTEALDKDVLGDARPISRNLPPRKNSLKLSKERNHVRKLEERLHYLQRLLWDGMYTTAAGGKAVIINNIKFDLHQKEPEERTGAQHDSKKTERAFQNLGSRVEVYENKTGSDMMKIIQLQAKADHTNDDYFVCVIMSHGEHGKVCGSDGLKVEVLDLVNCVSSCACPSLSGKPKVFIIQACQGTKEQTGRQETEETEETEEADASPPCPDIGVFISNEADVFIGLATFPGFVTKRDKQTGALYINKLVEVLNSEGQEQDLNTMMTKVNHEMNGDSKSVSCFFSSLRKKLYFVMPENLPQYV